MLSAASHDICIEFIIKIPTNLDDRIFYEKAEILNKSSSQVVVLCGKFSYFIMYFIEVECKAQNSDFNRQYEENFNVKLHKCNATPDLGKYILDFGTTYHVYKAVYALAHSLHNIDFYLSKNAKGTFMKNQKLMKEVPVSMCSEDCPLGFRTVMKRGIHRCCFECIQCPEGEISNETDKGSCQKCSEEEWPNDNNQCVPKPVEFLSYGNDPAPLTVSVISILLFVKTSAIFCVFIVFRDTPVVRANNQNLSFILLVSIMLSFLCVFLFLGRPGPISCMFRQTSFGIIFSVAVSSILAKTIMVYMAFKATKPGSFWRKHIGLKIPNCLVLLCSFIQVLISITWLLTACPFPETNTDIYVHKIIIQCNEGSMLAFSILLGYMGLLAAVSFIVAFLARNLPDSYNEAKYITFSMLVFCSVWIAFIPAYMSVTGKNTVLVEIFAIIASSLGILGCIFIPKCYIILVRPDLNSKGQLVKQTKT
ncbi:vomeronasal type-2 receptor 26-like [Lithobates pipiens]